MLGSLEFCTSTLGTRLILVLGHTQCSAIKGATKMFLQSGGRIQVESLMRFSGIDGIEVHWCFLTATRLCCFVLYVCVNSANGAVRGPC